MINEDYISFETAKLLKEKGFDAECDYLYVDGQLVRAQGCACNWNSGETLFTDYKNECSAPTLQRVMKWLREVHNIGIFPSLFAFCVGEGGAAKPTYGTKIISLESCELLTTDTNPMPTYEQACEAAIKYCLENLI